MTSTRTNNMRRSSMHVVLIVVAVACTSHGAVGVCDETVSFDREAGKSLTARYGDQILWQFHFDRDLPKPFFHPVAVPDGSVLTWNSPPDHRWHHGLWFSWKFINGVNYWEPNNQTGEPDGRTEWPSVRTRTTSKGTAKIEMELTYRTDKVPVLTEQRTIFITPPAKDGDYHFDWVCKFTAGPDEVKLDRTPLPHEPGGKVYGGYAGLSVRLAKELTEREATTNDGPVEFTPQNRYRGKAKVMDYSGAIAGERVGIAICDHPANLNHPSPWYVIRTQVMSYYSPAVICYEPYKLQPGESLTLKYRVIVHREKWNSERLTKEYKRYVTNSGEEK